MFDPDKIQKEQKEGRKAVPMSGAYILVLVR